MFVLICDVLLTAGVLAEFLYIYLARSIVLTV